MGRKEMKKYVEQVREKQRKEFDLKLVIKVFYLTPLKIH